MHMGGLDTHFATPHTRTEYLNQRGYFTHPYKVSSAPCPPNYEPVQKLWASGTSDVYLCYSAWHFN